MDFAAIRDEEDAAKARLAQHAVAFVFNLPLDDIVAPTRGSKRAAFARQVAMYMVHTAFGVSVARTAQVFGRDRTTVAHACHLVEDRREDPALDDRLDALEGFLRAAPAPLQDKAA
jgi:chromosomal replication initiation ATPase DnaA